MSKFEAIFDILGFTLELDEIYLQGYVATVFLYLTLKSDWKNMNKWLSYGLTQNALFTQKNALFTQKARFLLNSNPNPFWNFLFYFF